MFEFYVERVIGGEGVRRDRTPRHFTTYQKHAVTLVNTGLRCFTAFLDVSPNLTYDEGQDVGQIRHAKKSQRTERH